MAIVDPCMCVILKQEARFRLDGSSDTEDRNGVCLHTVFTWVKLYNWAISPLDQTVRARWVPQLNVAVLAGV